MENSKSTKWVRLGDYIVQRREKNEEYDVPILGVTRNGFIPPKQDGADTSLYNVFYKYDFVFNPARMELNSIYLNLDYDKAICSSLYEIFYIKDTQILCPEYLNLFIKRDEFARYCWFDAIGSARNYFRVSNMQDIRIPLPSIEVQQELVTAYKGLKELAEQNEALLPQMSAACHAYIVDCRDKYPLVALGDVVELCDERVGDKSFAADDVIGISNDKSLIQTKANMVGVSLTPYKLLYPNTFCYVTVTSRNGDKISIALNQSEHIYIVSSSYVVFRSKDNELLIPEYLFLMLNRSEFDRYSRYNSWGSARETFDWTEMCRIRIPLPPIEVQQAIVDVYHCMERAKTIATEARARLKQICPALIQRAAHT
jgi:type I restriction enzyme S subunit